LDAAGVPTIVSGLVGTPIYLTKTGCESLGNHVMTLTSSNNPPQTLDLEGRSIYINGNLYQKDQAIQVACHLNAMGMLDTSSLNSWVNEITREDRNGNGFTG
jgi:hypothetical protein